MHHMARNRLSDFYGKALLSPELLCLNCGHSDWGPGGRACSAAKRQDCLLFVTQVAGELGAARAEAAPPDPSAATPADLRG